MITDEDLEYREEDTVPVNTRYRIVDADMTGIYSKRAIDIFNELERKSDRRVSMDPTACQAIR